MIQIDLSQYSETARRDLCMALYRMTERHNPRPEGNQAESTAKQLKGGVTDDQS